MNQVQTTHPPVENGSNTTKIVLAAIGSSTVLAATYLFVSNDYNINVNFKNGEARFALSKNSQPITN